MTCNHTYQKNEQECLPQESVAVGSVDASSVTLSAVASCPQCEALSESWSSLFLDIYSREARSYFPLSILSIKTIFRTLVLFCIKTKNKL